MPDKTGEKQEGGRFRPGQSGNPAGRPKGVKNKASLLIELLIAGRLDDIVAKLVEQATWGDVRAIGMCLDRIAPARREAPIRIDLPEIRTLADAADASAALISAVAEGSMTLGEADRAMGLIDRHKLILAAKAEMEARIAVPEVRREPEVRSH